MKRREKVLLMIQRDRAKKNTNYRRLRLSSQGTTPGGKRSRYQPLNKQSKFHQMPVTSQPSNYYLRQSSESRGSERRTVRAGLSSGCRNKFSEFIKYGKWDVQVGAIQKAPQKLSCTKDALNSTKHVLA